MDGVQQVLEREQDLDLVPEVASAAEVAADDVPADDAPANDPIALGDALDRCASGVGRAHLDLLERVAACEKAELWKRDECRSGAEWLAGRLGITSWKAGRLIHTAATLPTLARTRDALASGYLSLDKVLELARFATPDTEKKLLRWARRVSPSAIRARADKERRIERDELDHSHSDRDLDWWWEPEGTRFLYEGMLPADEGAMLEAVLDGIVERLKEGHRSTADDAPRPTLGQLRADALAELVAAYGTSAADPSRATVVVHAPLEALSHDACNPAFEGGQILHPETARRLACDCRLQVVLEGAEGNALGIGRESQNVPRWLRRQMLWRDGHRCTFPGCERRSYLQAHHIRHWVKRGPTDLDNLTTLCSFHHHLAHEGRWSVARVSYDEVIWFRPSGRRYDPGPAP